MPTFAKSPPELVARFDELAPLAGDADRKLMFGYPVCVLRGNMFMGLHADSLILRLNPADRAEFLDRYDAVLFEPMPGRPMKEYVIVPPAVVGDDDAGHPETSGAAERPREVSSHCPGCSTVRVEVRS